MYAFHSVRHLSAQNTWDIRYKWFTDLYYFDKKYKI